MTGTMTGLDVHARSIDAAICVATGELTRGVLAAPRGR